MLQIGEISSNFSPPQRKALNTMKTLLAQYNENEANNDHSENYSLLANNFGDESEKFICNANINFRDRFGYASHELSSLAHQCTKKYITLLQ